MFSDQPGKSSQRSKQDMAFQTQFLLQHTSIVHTTQYKPKKNRFRECIVQQ